MKPTATARASNPAAKSQGPITLTMIGVALSGLFPLAAQADDAAPPATGKAPPPAVGNEFSIQQIQINGTVANSAQDVPQAITTVNEKLLQDQGITRLQDALRNVPGVTMNAGEGGPHGDSFNLRGLSIPDSFFLDGLRDIGTYQRDTFNQQSVEVLLGPSSTLFGRGSTSGVINSVSKQPLLKPIESGTITVGTADDLRATADLNWVIDPHSAFRINAMDEHSGVADRNYVFNRRNGLAPTLALGINTDTRITASLMHQQENNIPDYGIPFIDGSPAQVNRNNFYGLLNYDRTQTENDIATVRVEHDFNSDVTLTNTLRYGHYNFQYLLSAPHLDNDFSTVPPPGTPLSQIGVYFDQPSSGGTTTELINRTDLTTDFNTGDFKHILITGVELSREGTNLTRYINGIDVIPPTSLLNPYPYYWPPTALDTDTAPHMQGTDISVYAMDSISLTRTWDLDLGLRLDRFNSYFSEATTGTAFSRTDTEVSPRAALVYKPTKSQSYYVSYGSSFNPAIEYLSIAPSSSSLTPEKDKTAEIGSKLLVLNDKLSLTAALFDTKLTNARLADPDDPTVQQMPFDQSVKGLELAANGRLDKHWEITAAYTHLNDRIAATTDTPALGMRVPNIPTDAANLWMIYEQEHAWKVGGGLNYVSQRFADTYNTVSVPAYVVANAMASYRVNPHLNLQFNLNNIGNKLYYNSVYYTETDENHAVPGAGRTALLTASIRY